MNLRSYLVKRRKANPESKKTGDPAPFVDQNHAEKSNAQSDNENANPSGEPGNMSATLDTLALTQAVEPRSAGGSEHPKFDPNAMKFTHPSGSTPLQGFTLKRGVGVGGFGEVYFAVSDAGKEVALKRILRNLDIELRGVAHCLNLKHPNLISLYDIRYDDSRQAWVVMEYVSGDSLRATLDRSPNGLTESESRRWFAALAAGVAHLHESGIVHRDLKPANIFSDEGIVKIGDYGLSKYISCSRRGGHTESVGTFHYMAPEVGRGDYGREIDIYAMAIVLYEMLTGTVPFDGESSHEIVMKHLTANPDLSGVAEPYRSVIWQALQKNPAARQQTVAQMIRPLGMVLDEHGLVRASQGSLDDPVAGRLVGRYEDPEIQFAPLGPAPVAMRATSARPQAVAGGGEMRFGDVQYHASAARLAAAGGLPSVPRQTRREEPLAKAVRSTASDLSRWWTSLEPFPGTRLVLLLMGIALIVLNTGWLLPLLTVVAVVYVPYYVVRAMFLGVSKQPSYAEAHQAALVRANRPRALTIKEWKDRKRTELAAKSTSTRLVELGGSMSTSVIALGIIGVLAIFATTNVFDRGFENIGSLELAPVAWSAVVAAVGSAAMLFFGKLWERESEPTFRRRVVMLGAGAGLGAFAYALANFLMIDQGLGRETSFALPPALYAADGSPYLAAMMAHFAVLFAGLRWWKVADPLRRRRFSLWATAVAIVAEWGLQQVLPIPQPAGMIATGMLAAAVQFAAPWENPKQRLQYLSRETTQIA